MKEQVGNLQPCIQRAKDNISKLIHYNDETSTFMNIKRSKQGLECYIPYPIT